MGGGDRGRTPKGKFRGTFLCVHFTHRPRELFSCFCIEPEKYSTHAAVFST